jgi:hypothetical protein
MSDLSLLWEEERKSDFRAARSVDDPTSDARLIARTLIHYAGD